MTHTIYISELNNKSSYEILIATILNSPFNGDRGWINIDTFEHLKIYKPGIRLLDINFECKEEVVMPNGTIWFYLEKLS